MSENQFENFKFEKEKEKKRSKLIRNVEENFIQKESGKNKKPKTKEEKKELEKLEKDSFFLFYYQRLDNRKTKPRNYRLDLERVIFSKFKDKKIKKIPEETEITLRFGFKYLVVFENREELKNINRNMVFDRKKFIWLKGIELQEHGDVIDNY